MMDKSNSAYKTIGEVAKILNFKENQNIEPIFYEINNIQQLSNLITKEFKKVTLD